jgi:hypothetical protein
MTILSLTAEERHVPAANQVIGFNTTLFNDSKGRMLEDPLIPQRGGTEENEETDGSVYYFTVRYPCPLRPTDSLFSLLNTRYIP